MTKKKQHYSSHVQLQYLIHKYKINLQEFSQELDRYYATGWTHTRTKSGKITSSVKQTTPVATLPPQPPKVIVKKRKTIVRP